MCGVQILHGGRANLARGACKSCTPQIIIISRCYQYVNPHNTTHTLPPLPIRKTQRRSRAQSRTALPLCIILDGALLLCYPCTRLRRLRELQEWGLAPPSLSLLLQLASDLVLSRSLLQCVCCESDCLCIAALLYASLDCIC